MHLELIFKKISLLVFFLSRTTVIAVFTTGLKADAWGWLINNIQIVNCYKLQKYSSFYWSHLHMEFKYAERNGDFVISYYLKIKLTECFALKA